MTKSVDPLSRSEGFQRMAEEMNDAAERISELLQPYKSYMRTTDPAVAEEGAFAFVSAALGGYFASRYRGSYPGLYKLLKVGVRSSAGDSVIKALDTLGERILAGLLGNPDVLTRVPTGTNARDPLGVLFDHMVAAVSEPEDLVGTWSDYADSIVREADWIARRLEGIDVENGKEEIAAIEDRVIVLGDLLDMRDVYSFDSRYRRTWGGIVVRELAGEIPNYLMFIKSAVDYAGDPEILRDVVDAVILKVTRLFQPVSHLKQMYTVARELQEGIRIMFPEEGLVEPAPVNRIPMFHLTTEILDRVGDPSRKDDPPAIAVGWEGEEFVVSNRSADGGALRAFREGEPGRMRIVRLAEEMGGEVSFEEAQAAEAGAIAEISSMRIIVPMIASAPIAVRV